MKKSIHVQLSKLLHEFSASLDEKQQEHFYSFLLQYDNIQNIIAQQSLELYKVLMIRYGEEETAHKYVSGYYFDLGQAIVQAKEHCTYRGGKYYAKIFLISNQNGLLLDTLILNVDDLLTAELDLSRKQDLNKWIQDNELIFLLQIKELSKDDLRKLSEKLDLEFGNPAIREWKQSTINQEIINRR